MIAILLIGDELLSAQVEDKNLAYALHHFALSGHKVSEVRFVPDDQSDIALALRDLSAKHKYVITSGGVGPTHDDCTLLAAAKAFSTKLERNIFLEHSLRDFYKEKITEAALTMADIPQNSELLDKEGDNWPIIKIKNCFILAGVPQIFKQKFDRLLKFLPSVKPYFIASLYLKSDEVFFAEKLSQIAMQNPHIAIGSYPIFSNKNYNVHVTLKHNEESKLEAVFEELVQYFTLNNSLVKVDSPELFKPVSKVN